MIKDSDIKQFALKHRKYLHQHPEVSLEEYETSKYCQAVLQNLGYAVKTIWKTGFIADLNLNKDKTIAIRAEMDALPIEEKTELEYSSLNKGVSHACGHDVHMSIALTTAKLLLEHNDKLNCNVRFLFQPSEELAPGGAKFMIQNGALECVNEIYGLHNNPKLQIGKIKCLHGSVTASCNTFDVLINGSGGHAASPNTSLDPIVASVEMINKILLLRSKAISPMHPGVVNVTNIKAGTGAYGVIPDTAFFSGIVRTFHFEDKICIKRSIESIGKQLSVLNYKVDISFEDSYPSIVNKAYGVERVVNSAKRVITEENIITTGEPEPWGEDFSYYLNEIPGAFFILGSGNLEKHITKPLHSSDFLVDTDCLFIGAKIFLEIVKGYKK